MVLDSGCSERHFQWMGVLSVQRELSPLWRFLGDVCADLPARISRLRLASKIGTAWTTIPWLITSSRKGETVVSRTAAPSPLHTELRATPARPSRTLNCLRI